MVSTMKSDFKAAQETRNCLRSTFLSSLGAIFLIAFWSYYTSFPGLLSSSGIEPVGRLLPYANPWIHRQFIRPGISDADSFCELAAVVGIILSCLALSGWVQHGALYAVLTALYSILSKAGGTFYSFQWDSLLIETGMVTSLCYAPWMCLRPHDRHTTSDPWPLRFLLFKLMFMSGIVKIQSECPTWKNLTALEYHFATQCLPGPFAWHAHQLHPLFLRLSVAVTLWIEIPVAFLLLGPSVTMRRISACFQMVLQVVIMLTGNYNFFNLLTVALCLPCLERDEPKQPNRRSRWEHIVTSTFLAWSFHRMFEFHFIHPSHDWWRYLNVSLDLTKNDCDLLSEWAIPVLIPVTVIFIALRGVRNFRKSQNPSFLIRSVVSAVIVGIIGMPLTLLTASLKTNGFMGSQTVFSPLWHTYAQPHRLTNGYGLFRRMTGVGSVSPDDASDGWGWAGQPPSVVARSEIILEGVFEGDDSEPEQWHELSFRWKPGHVHAMPRQVAPHQPRLDWQMWFAALGSPQSNLWFLHLLKKLLDNCHPVQHLLGDPNLTKGRKLRKIRAKLYHYDFTRIKSEWSRGIPGVELTDSMGADAPSMRMGIIGAPIRYWRRKVVRMYIGAIDRADGALENHLLAFGYENICGDASRHRCASVPSISCYLASSIRENNLHLAPMGVFFMFVLFHMKRSVIKAIQ